MRFVIAGGGVAGLAAALAVARAGHEAVVLERDAVEPQTSPDAAFAVERHGIPHFFQPHAFLPRGRRVLQELAPDVIDDLIQAGADPQDLRDRLHGAAQPGDEDLVWLWVRRPVIEWALRRAAAAQDGVELRSGGHVSGLVTSENGVTRAVGVHVDDREEIRGDVVVDALGRYRCPAGWPRPKSSPTDSGGIYYCRYYTLVDGVEHMDAPLLNPRGDLGYMGFNTFRGDNRTYAVILVAPTADRDLRVLRHEPVWRAACAAITPLNVMTSDDYGRPITDVMPMGGLMNVDRTAAPGVAGIVAMGDALCHTDPAFAYGVSFSLVHATALRDAAAESPDVDAVVDSYRAAVRDEAQERYRLVCDTDDARGRRWAGDAVEVGRHHGCYPLFSFTTALAAAPHDDHVLRRTVRRIGLLDRTAVFDGDSEVHRRIEEIFQTLMSTPRPPVGPPRDELLSRLGADRAALD